MRWILAGSLLVLFLASCTTSGTITAFGPETPPACSAKDFAGKIYWLDAFNPYANGDANGDGTYDPPAIDSRRPVADSTRNTFKNVFTGAPPYLQRRLCELKYVLLDDRNFPKTSGQQTGAWGFWENPRTQNARNWKYVGINPAVLDSKISLASYENEILKDLKVGGTNASYQSSPDHTPEMTILAIMAHEVGHVVWRDEWTASGCYTGTWKKPDPLPKQQKFHQFGIDVGEAYKPNRTQIKTKLSDKRPNEARDDLHKLFSSINRTKQRWASVFATVAPDEDFAETYKLKVLHEAQPVEDMNHRPIIQPVTELNILLPKGASENARTINLMDGLATQSPLKAKADCFRDRNYF